MPLLDVKIRDLMTTAAAALREGGELLLAHEFRGDMPEVFVLMEKVCWICFLSVLPPSFRLLPLLLVLPALLLMPCCSLPVVIYFRPFWAVVVPAVDSNYCCCCCQMVFAACDRERVWRAFGGSHGERSREDSAVTRVQRQGAFFRFLFCF